MTSLSHTFPEYNFCLYFWVYHYSITSHWHNKKISESHFPNRYKVSVLIWVFNQQHLLLLECSDQNIKQHWSTNFSVCRPMLSIAKIKHHIHKKEKNKMHWRTMVTRNFLNKIWRYGIKLNNKTGSHNRQVERSAQQLFSVSDSVFTWTSVSNFIFTMLYSSASCTRKFCSWFSKFSTRFWRSSMYSISFWQRSSDCCNL